VNRFSCCRQAVVGALRSNPGLQAWISGGARRAAPPERLQESLDPPTARPDRSESGFPRLAGGASLTH